MAKKIFLSNNIRSIKAQTRNIPLEQLYLIQTKLKQIINERQQEDDEAKQNLIEHNKKIDAYLQQIKNDGVAVTELLKKANLPAFKKRRKMRPPRPPKYKYIDNEGNLRTWTGQGRMPKPIQLALNSQTKSLSDFLI
ncbi:H-NS family nucleoid-associated regulatory protein [Orbus wheelerorum]|uniref:H-NS family histone-like protein n=1 Tax=Orbus wheelerorum TaxID=3074111 RepID=UPI00370D88B5